MTDEHTDDEPVQVDEEAVEVEEEVVEAHAEAEATADFEAPADVGSSAEGEAQATVDPAVQELIDEDATVLHEEPEGDGVTPAEFRTPPGIPSGLDPGTPGDRAKD
ncbi:MAG: hypothetical protein ACR2LK_16870 [Solirubrobacteraceae bacterium]